MGLKQQKAVDTIGLKRLDRPNSWPQKPVEALPGKEFRGCVQEIQVTIVIAF